MTYYSGKDLASAFRTVRQNTIQAAQDIPEAEYGFAAAEGCMTVGQVLAHLAARRSRRRLPERPTVRWDTNCLRLPEGQWCPSGRARHNHSIMR